MPMPNQTEKGATTDPDAGGGLPVADRYGPSSSDQSDLTILDMIRPELSYSASTTCPSRVIDSATRCVECQVVVVVLASPVPLASTLVVTSPRSFVV
jgi:hypothetical protein